MTSDEWKLRFIVLLNPQLSLSEIPFRDKRIKKTITFQKAIFYMNVTIDNHLSNPPS
jgi:hypothetical protein